MTIPKILGTKRKLNFGDFGDIATNPTPQQRQEERTSTAAQRVIAQTPNSDRWSATGTYYPPTPRKRSCYEVGTPQIQIGTPFAIKSWIDGSPIELIPLEYLGKGQQGTAWRVQMPDGSEAVYKTIRPKVNELKEELLQYAQLRELRFPVAIYHDLEDFIHMREFQEIYTMENSTERNQKLVDFVKCYLKHPYHLREYVNPFPDEFDLSSPYYDQVRGMFETAHESRIGIDLQKSNLGINADGTVILFDLMPQKETFRMILPGCLATFAPEGSELHRSLDPRL